MITFSELTKQVHLVKDLILSDMICGTEDETKDESTNFSKYLSVMKKWFSRISWANKKRYLLALLQDVRSAWTLSCLLKSIWNCQPKDAVLSAHQSTAWSSYDLVPMDHNRTALPVATLAQVMKNGRCWFLSLEPQAQAIVLLELLSLSGGPIMCIVYRRSQVLYEKYRNEQLHNLKECIVLNDSSEDIKKSKNTEKSTNKENEWKPSSGLGEAQRELELNLLHWNRTIKELRDSLKLEELEMTFKNGTKSKIWKVNRPKPEAIETVDYIQLLPSEVAKKILSYLPQSLLGDYARVNKYWAYLVQDYQIELDTKRKLEINFEKLEQLMLSHDISLDFLGPMSQVIKPASFGITSIQLPSTRLKQAQPMSTRASERSAGAYSFRHLVGDHLTAPILAIRPIKNLDELSERLKRRGAADENIWKWCNNIIKNHKYSKVKRTAKGVIPHDNIHFPHPIIKQTLDIPLQLPMTKDPAAYTKLDPKRNISNATLVAMPKQPIAKRYKLWSKDFSGLYPVYKIPSHSSPI